MPLLLFLEKMYKIHVSELSESLIDDIFDDVESVEGKWNYALHRFRERDRGLVKLKKASVKNPICECCNFDFSIIYPNHGDGFIECHHKTPINQGKRITKLKDLALVCANCHRMLHRKNKENDYFSIKELKQIIINEYEYK